MTPHFLPRLLRSEEGVAPFPVMANTGEESGGWGMLGEAGVGSGESRLAWDELSLRCHRGIELWPPVRNAGLELRRALGAGNRWDLKPWAQWVVSPRTKP